MLAADLPDLALDKTQQRIEGMGSTQYIINTSVFDYFVKLFNNSERDRPAEGWVMLWEGKTKESDSHSEHQTIENKTRH